MRRKKKEAAESGPGAPMWMLSFSDMMTNVLCFFILLQAFASERQVGLLADGLGSFRDEVSTLGLPGSLPGSRAAVDLGAGRVFFRPPRSINPKNLVEPDGKIADANRDALRAVVLEAIKKTGVTMIPTAIVFEPDVTTLTLEHRSFLETLAPFLRLGRYPVTIQGYSFEEGGGPDDGWRISEARARAVGAGLAELGLQHERITVVGHGMLTRGAGTLGAVRSVQNSFGRRIVTISLGP